MTVAKDTAIITGIGLVVLLCTALVLRGVWSTSPSDDALSQDSSGLTRAASEPRRRVDEDPSGGSSVGHLFLDSSETVMPLFTSESLSTLQGTVRGDDGNAVHDALLSLMEDQSSSGGFSIEGPTIAACRTDTKGAFSFGRLTARKHFVLLVEHVDHATATVPRIVLDAGRTTVRTIRLRSGRTVTGRVLGVSGEGLGGVTIRIEDLARHLDYGRAGLESTTVSGRDGTFQFSHISVGRKRVTALLNGFATQTLQGVSVLRDGTTPPLMFRMPMGLSISGRVVDGDGNGLAGVQLTPTPKRRGTPQALPGYYQAAVSDETGSFEVSGLAPGAYTVTARLVGYGRDGVRVNARSGDDQLLFEMIRNPTVQGRVIDAETQLPLKEFLLMFGPSPHLLRFISSQARMIRDSDGRFEIVAPDSTGTIYLFAWARNRAWGSSDAISLVPGQTVNDIVIDLTVGAEIRGVVSGPQAQPVSGARVELVPTLPDNGKSGTAFFTALLRRGGRSRGLRTRTDAQGNYRFQNVHAGSFQVYVSASGLTRGELAAPVTLNSQDPVNCEPIQLMIGARLRGDVTDENGKPLEGARIEMRPRGGRAVAPRSAESDSLGRFEFRHVRAGMHELIVIGGGGGSLFPQARSSSMVSRNVLLEDGVDERISLVLKASRGRR